LKYILYPLEDIDICILYIANCIQKVHIVEIVVKTYDFPIVLDKDNKLIQRLEA